MAKTGKEQEAAQPPPEDDVIEIEPIEPDKLKSMNVYQRIAYAMTIVRNLGLKDGTVSGGGTKFDFHSHDKVTERVRPAMMAAGLVVIPTVDKLEHETYKTKNGGEAWAVWSTVTSRFVNIDNPEDCFGVTMIMQACDTQDKGPGKAVSYATKYAMMKALLLATGEDTDDDRAPEMGPRQPTQGNRQVPAAPPAKEPAPRQKLAREVMEWSGMRGNDVAAALQSIKSKMGIKSQQASDSEVAMMLGWVNRHRENGVDFMEAVRVAADETEVTE